MRRSARIAALRTACAQINNLQTAKEQQRKQSQQPQREEITTRADRTDKALDQEYAVLQSQAHKSIRVPRLRGTHGSLTSTGLALLFFYRNMGKVRTLSQLKEFMAACNHPAVKDPQPRHLGLQHGFRFLVQGSKHPKTRRLLRAGEYCLLTVKQPHINFICQRGSKKGQRQVGGHRTCTVNASMFERIKEKYARRCAHCGSVQGEPHLKNRLVITSLQMGHMDPRQPLVPGNCIPLCSVCNRVYKDKVLFTVRGYVRPL